MPILRLAVLAFALAFTGCAGMQDPFDNTDRDMTPLPGSSARPNIKNRFPESRGGLPLSRADREDEDMTPMERLKQY